MQQQAVELYPHPGNRLPTNARVHSVITKDGTHLRAMSAFPANPKATLLLLGGRADYMERYFETIQELVNRGFAVVTFDWRGQGGSQRLHADAQRGYVKSFRGFDDDLQSVFGQIATQTLPGPYYALAHSTGGNVLLRALRTSSLIEKAVVTSPLLGFNFGKWPKPVALALTKAAIATGFGGTYLPGMARGPFGRHEFEGNPLTSDPRRWDRDISTLEMNPQLGLGGPTYAWFNAAWSSMRELHHWKRNALIACPTLFVASGKEWVVDGTATRDFATRVPGISYIKIAGARHEILMERDEFRKQFWSAFDSYFLG